MTALHPLDRLAQNVHNTLLSSAFNRTNFGLVLEASGERYCEHEGSEISSARRESSKDATHDS